MQTTDIVPNAFLDNLGTDWIAVAANGHIVGRATTREALEHSTPGAAYYCQKDLDAGSKNAGKAATADPVGMKFEWSEQQDPTTWSTEPPTDEKPADEKPADEKPADEKPADEKPAKEELPPDSELKKPITGAEKFDHDGDGHVGGRKRKPKA